MNPNSINHLFNDHNAKIFVDKDGRFIITAHKFKIPAVLEQILRPYAKYINGCWFCVLKDFEELKSGRILQFEFSLLNKNIKDKSTVENLKKELVKMDYLVYITEEAGDFVFRITKDKTIFNKTKFLYKNS